VSVSEEPNFEENEVVDFFQIDDSDCIRLANS
jgi:hypothetical protein